MPRVRVCMCTVQNVRSLSFVRADSSPERSVSLAEPCPEHGDVAAACTEGPEDCPPELYNLTKLAEVSLAAAAGHLFSQHVLHSDTSRDYGAVRPPEGGTEVRYSCLSDSPTTWRSCLNCRQYTVCFKKSFTTSKAHINLFGGHIQCFEL
jgi:hypothetical protein